MLWIILPVSIILLVALRKFLGSQVHGKNLRREDFERRVRSLLLLMEDGGILHVKHRGSPVYFDFMRSQGCADAATVTVEVPRTAWSEAHQARMYDVFVSNNFDARQDVSSSTLAQVRVPVDDIWVVWSGAKAARAAHLLLDVLGVPKDARFDLALRGARSTRALTTKKVVRGG
jgi:hypothetical protein